MARPRRPYPPLPDPKDFRSERRTRLSNRDKAWYIRDFLESGQTAEQWLDDHPGVPIEKSIRDEERKLKKGGDDYYENRVSRLNQSLHAFEKRDKKAPPQPAAPQRGRWTENPMRAGAGAGSGGGNRSDEELSREEEQELEAELERLNDATWKEPRKKSPFKPQQRRRASTFSDLDEKLSLDEFLEVERKHNQIYREKNQLINQILKLPIYEKNRLSLLRKEVDKAIAATMDLKKHGTIEYKRAVEDYRTAFIELRTAYRKITNEGMPSTNRGPASRS